MTDEERAQDFEASAASCRRIADAANCDAAWLHYVAMAKLFQRHAEAIREHIGGA